MGSSQSKGISANNVAASKLTLIDEKRRSASPSVSTRSSPKSASGALSLSNVADWESTLESDSKVQLSRTILSHADIHSALTSRTARIASPHVFNTQVDFKTNPVTNQKSSGRCWLFATTNVLRYSVMQKLKLKEFQLSQSYLFFWDKLNKANYYLETSIETADLPIDDRLVNHLAKDLISDGGQWDMAVNLLEQYGMVPQSIYPESTHSSLSGPLNTLLKMKLREHALVLRKLSSSLRADASLSDTEVVAMLRAKKEDLMKEVYTVMTATLGVPVRPDETFVFDYYDEDDKAGTWEGTPVEFYKAFCGKYPAGEKLSLINDPRHAYGKLYTVDRLGNVWGGRPIRYVNTTTGDLKAAVVASIKAGQAVFFGCDVGQFSDTTGGAGIMDTDLFEYENAFNISLSLTKAERIQMNESAMTHAMVISAVHVDEKTGRATRFKVENSWGDTSGEKGYNVMTEKWFDEFVYQVVVHKSHTSKELVKVFDSGDAVVLPAWDPMGALA